MHASSLAKCTDFLSRFCDRGKPLAFADVGSEGGASYRPLIDAPEWKYTGIDQVPGPNVDAVLSAPDQWAGHGARYDVIVCGQTLEHVPRPWEFLPLVVSILKPGGLLLLVAPNTWEYHRYPEDYWRFWPEAFRILMTDAGIDVIEVYASDADTVGIGRKSV